ncbi:hypothetical protein [Paenirhodobacter sp.]|uniref:hypothetical protein n=1 Tax=Paenirhodobacter sp. TaxID=1965326 RepID=UPI003B3D11BE
MMKRRTILSALLCAGLSLPAFAEVPQKAMTAGGHAWGEVKRAVVKDGVLHVEAQFLTDYVGYSGERLYADIPADRLNAAIYVMKGDQTFPLWLRDGKAKVPGKLDLTFNYDPQRNPRVGKWQADFVAPEADVTEAFLILPNVAPIGPFPIRRP